MENFKSILFSLVGIAMMAGVGLWAFSTIESGSVHVNTDKQKALEDQNKDLNKQVTDLKSQMAIVEAEKASELAAAVAITLPPAPTTPVKTPVATTTKTTLKYQSLINELQNLVSSRIVLKKGSQGASVGSVQKFLNIYNGTSTKVDNDFGASMVTAITKFQKSSGITSSGQVASATLTKMIDWLKKK